MARALITQQELDKEIAGWLEEHPDHPMAEAVERIQMGLASPGQWEVARVTPAEETDSQGQD